MSDEPRPGARAPERHRARLATLAFVRSGRDVLLRRHPETSDRFVGRWNGIGGHVEAGEGIHAAALRELREETGLRLERLRLRGVIHESGLLGHAYVVFLFLGETHERALVAPREGELVWQPIEKLGERPLVADLAELLPRLLGSGDPFFVTQTFDGADRPLSLRVEGPDA
jgi:8-oxo-dGTP diphosphatase